MLALALMYAHEQVIDTVMRADMCLVLLVFILFT